VVGNGETIAIASARSVLVEAPFDRDEFTSREEPYHPMGCALADRAHAGEALQARKAVSGLIGMFGKRKQHDFGVTRACLPRPPARCKAHRGFWSAAI
jgi:hypothetical protein